MKFVTRRQFMKGALAGATVGTAAGVRPTRARAQLRASDPLDTFQHVVVLMLENRSFDNLLGFLYPPGEPPGQQFAGLAGGQYCNPIPPGVVPPVGETSVCVGQISGLNPGDYNQPFPDPGEEYPHINTQLYNVVAPPDNLPGVLPSPAPMTGFVTDYIANYPTGLANPPTYNDYKIIMQSFAPSAIPVLTTLAREFAVFDHWFCSVPSQTWCNRAFWHAATSGGHVINPGSVSELADWTIDNDVGTLFNAISASPAGLDWRLYTGNPLALEHAIHAIPLEPFDEAHFPPLEQFFTDCAAGQLQEYTFIEPTFTVPNNDYHPPSYNSDLFGPFDPGAVKLGEVLVNRVYNAIRTSASTTGNNWSNTLLIITFDEHGGCFDHVSPPSGTPPDQLQLPGEDGFLFDRLGVRVPMIMVSAHVGRGTIVNTPFDHTSFIRTMMKKWSLTWNGQTYLTERDRVAPTFEEVFTLTGPTHGLDWPVIPDPILPLGWLGVDYSKVPLSQLQRSMLLPVAARRPDGQRELERIHTVGDAESYLRSAVPDAKTPPSRRFWLRGASPS